MSPPPDTHPLTEPTVPPHLYYLMEHFVWADLLADGSIRVGISHLGIQLSGEIYMCRPKRVGSAIEQSDTIAVVELAKSIVAVKSAISGDVLEINQSLDSQPWLVHRDPYGAGWIARLQPSRWAQDHTVLLTGAEAQGAMAKAALAHALERVPATSGPLQPSS